MIERMEEFLEILKDVPYEYWDSKNLCVDLNGKWEYSIASIEGDKIVGYIICSIKNETLHIHKFMVYCLFRNYGMGSALLREFESSIMLKFKTVTLKVHKENSKAIRFYEKNGFKIIEENTDLYLMKKLYE